MVFIDKKIPRHLIIQEDYEIRQRPRFGFLKVFIVSVLVVSLTYIIGLVVVQG